MPDNSNTFYNLDYTHYEIQELLRKMASGHVLYPDDYEKLINVIGLDNISTFSGNYEDLINTPNIPYYISDLKDDLDLATVDSVNRKLEALRENIVSLLNEYENENESIFAYRTELDRQLNDLENTLKIYLENQIAQLPIGGFASKSEVARKSELGHLHTIEDVEGLKTTLAFKADLQHTHDNYELIKSPSHQHDNEAVLDNITESQFNYWNRNMEELISAVDLINEKLAMMDQWILYGRGNVNTIMVDGYADIEELENVGVGAWIYVKMDIYNDNKESMYLVTEERVSNGIKYPRRYVHLSELM